MKGGVIPVRGAMVHTGELELVQEDFQGGVIHRGGGMIAMELPHSPLCSFSCSFRCFLKLKDFPQVGSEQVKVFWCTCWYFWWCCRGGKKTPVSSQFQLQDTPPRLPSAPRERWSLQVLTFRYWRLEKILPQPSKSHRRISCFAAFLTKKTWEKSLAGRRRRI